jgi:hypothetical protein
MQKIKVERLSEEQLKNLGVFSWPIWEKEVSRFDWHYDTVEKCLFLEGEVIVEAGEEKIKIGKGDFVTFPKGLSCTWDIKVPVRKHYSFE